MLPGRGAESRFSPRRLQQASLGAIQKQLMAEESTRTALRDTKRIVVKIGSRALCAEGGRYALVAEQLATQVEAGRKVVLVSSGAVAVGRERLELSERPKKIALLQAAAATGQSLLMRAYEDAFEARGIHVAQVLLTHDVMSDRERYLHARRALDQLLKLGVVPIINENDTVSIDELRFGDNDQLAAMVCTLIGADLLVLLSDVEGVLDDRGQRVSLVRDVSEIESFIRPPEDDVGLGGMQSKVEAARRATLLESAHQTHRYRDRDEQTRAHARGHRSSHHVHRRLDARARIRPRPDPSCMARQPQARR